MKVKGKNKSSKSSSKSSNDIKNGKINCPGVKVEIRKKRKKDEFYLTRESDYGGPPLLD